MGGSGGNLSMSLGERAALEDKAKAVIRDGAEPQRRNVFLSFASEDLQQVNLLRGQAKNDTSELVLTTGRCASRSTASKLLTFARESASGFARVRSPLCSFLTRLIRASG